MGDGYYAKKSSCELFCDVGVLALIGFVLYALVSSYVKWLKEMHPMPFPVSVQLHCVTPHPPGGNVARRGSWSVKAFDTRKSLL